MGKKTKTGKSRLDTYYHLAKEQGYRSRAAFKLIQLNKKHVFLTGAETVLDLCAAPGGWLQVIAGQVAVGSTVIGVDRVPIAPIPRCHTIVADLKDCVPMVKRLLGNKKIDVIVHDGAPNVGVAWKHDAYQQTELVLLALKICTVFLRENAHFVTKVFRCKEYNYLLWVFNQLFNSVEATKPEASRKVSAEIYVVCKGYKKPESLDPKLFDPRYVFKEIELRESANTAVSQSLVSSLFTPSRSRRQREGYADTNTGLLYKSLSIDSFIEQSNPTTLLASHHQLFIPNKHAYTALATEEILYLASDLQVLSKRDYKKLLKWRLHVRLEAGLDKLAADATHDREAELDITKIAETLDREKKLRLKREQRKRKERLGQTHLKLHENSSIMTPFEFQDIIDAPLDRDSAAAALLFERPLFQEARDLYESQIKEKHGCFVVDEVEEEDNGDAFSGNETDNEFQEGELESEYEKQVDVAEAGEISDEDFSSLDNQNDDEDNLSVVSMELEELVPKSKTPLLTDPVTYSLAQHRLRQSKDQLINESFNRYSTMENIDSLPRWFRDEEKKHQRSRVEPAKEAVAAIAEKSKRVDARCIRRVLEAKFRKKKRFQAQLKQRNSKAQRIMQTEGFNEAAKARAIHTLYSKALKKPRESKRLLVVAKGTNKRCPGRPSGVKGRYKMVDRRLKKETRALKRIKKTKKVKRVRSKSGMNVAQK